METHTKVKFEGELDKEFLKRIEEKFLLIISIRDIRYEPPGKKHARKQPHLVMNGLISERMMRKRTLITIIGGTKDP